MSRTASVTPDGVGEERPRTAAPRRIEETRRAAREEALLAEDRREAIHAHSVPVVIPREEENASPGAERRVRLGGEPSLPLSPPRVALAGEAVRVEVVSEVDDEGPLRVPGGLRGDRLQERLADGGLAGVPHEEERLDGRGKRARRGDRLGRLQRGFAAPQPEEGRRREDAPHFGAARVPFPFAFPRPLFRSVAESCRSSSASLWDGAEWTRGLDSWCDSRTFTEAEM